MKFTHVIFTIVPVIVISCSQQNDEKADIKPFKHLVDSELVNTSLNNQQYQLKQRNEILDNEDSDRENIEIDSYEENNENMEEIEANKNNRMMHSTRNGTLIGTYHENAYGLGIHSDGSGRAFKWQTSDGEDVNIGKVNPNGYGIGIGQDEFGRPVYANPK